MKFTEMKLLHQMLTTVGSTAVVTLGLAIGTIGGIHYFKDNEFYILRPSSSASVNEPVPNWETCKFDSRILQSILNNEQVKASINSKVNAAVSEAAKKGGVNFSSLTREQLNVLKTNSQVEALFKKDPRSLSVQELRDIIQGSNFANQWVENPKFTNLQQVEQGKYVSKDEYNRFIAVFGKILNNKADEWHVMRCYDKGQDAKDNPDGTWQTALNLLTYIINGTSQLEGNATQGMKEFAKYCGFVDCHGDGDIDALVKFYKDNNLSSLR